MKLRLALALCTVVLGSATAAVATVPNRPPVARAGVDRYVGADPLVLDAAGSFDPDVGDAIVSYTWTQVSGPALNLSNANTATPTVTATPSSTIGHAVLQLIVNDGEADSAPDTVTITIVASVQPSVQLTLENPPFDVNRPTHIFFGGGDCTFGGGGWGDYPVWRERTNVISFSDYEPPYDRCADAIIAYLSRVAPTYDKPIQTAGWSTGGMPAIDSATRLNRVFHDPRYDVTIVNLLDAACRLYNVSIYDFILYPVTDVQPYVQNFYSTTSEVAEFPFRNNAVNVAMEGSHGLPFFYYVDSIHPENFSTSVYNNGIVAGSFTSVTEFGPNYRMPWPPLTFSFHVVFDTPETLHLEMANPTAYPARFPEPVTLIGPAVEAAPLTGDTIGCLASQNSVRYEFLFGTSPDALTTKYVSSSPPALSTGRLPPSRTFYWTVYVRSALGIEFRADPKSFTTAPGLKLDVNADGHVNADDCALIQAGFGADWSSPAFHLAADYNGSGGIDCQDHLAWLADYRVYQSDPQAADPCGSASMTDMDGDGVVDLCDLCSDTLSGVPVTPQGCPVPIPGDIDNDGDVDQADFGRLQRCFSGNAVAYQAGCAPADLDRDGDVDPADAAILVKCMSGSDIPAQPNCAN